MTPSPHALLYDRDETAKSYAAGPAALCLLFAMLPSGPYCPVGSRDFPNFAAQLHGLLTRCLRFTSAITRGRARLATDFRRPLVGRDLNPLGHITWFQRYLGYIASSKSRLA